MINKRTFVTIAMTLATTLMMAGSSFAQIVPFLSTGENNLYTPVDGAFGGDGQTRQMGASSGTGYAIPVPTENPFVLDWFGGGSFVAANGDAISFQGGGTVYLNPIDGGLFTANWVGEFHITGGSGRFANVGPGTAPLDVIAINHPFSLNDPVWAYDYVISGDMELRESQAVGR